MFYIFLIFFTALIFNAVNAWNELVVEKSMYTDLPWAGSPIRHNVNAQKSTDEAWFTSSHHLALKPTTRHPFHKGIDYYRKDADGNKVEHALNGYPNLYCHELVGNTWLFSEVYQGTEHQRVLTRSAPGSAWTLRGRIEERIIAPASNNCAISNDESKIYINGNIYEFEGGEYVKTDSISNWSLPSNDNEFSYGNLDGLALGIASNNQAVTYKYNPHHGSYSIPHVIDLVSKTIVATCKAACLEAMAFHESESLYMWSAYHRAAFINGQFHFVQVFTKGKQDDNTLKGGFAVVYKVVGDEIVPITRINKYKLNPTIYSWDISDAGWLVFGNKYEVDWSGNMSWDVYRITEDNVELVQYLNAGLSSHPSSWAQIVSVTDNTIITGGNTGLSVYQYNGEKFNFVAKLVGNPEESQLKTPGICADEYNPSMDWANSRGIRPHFDGTFITMAHIGEACRWYDRTAWVSSVHEFQDEWKLSDATSGGITYEGVNPVNAYRNNRLKPDTPYKAGNYQKDYVLYGQNFLTVSSDKWMINAGTMPSSNGENKKIIGFEVYKNIASLDANPKWSKIQEPVAVDRGLFRQIVLIGNRFIGMSGDNLVMFRYNGAEFVEIFREALDWDGITGTNGKWLGGGTVNGNDIVIISAFGRKQSESEYSDSNFQVWKRVNNRLEFVERFNLDHHNKYLQYCKSDNINYVNLFDDRDVYLWGGQKCSSNNNWYDSNIFQRIIISDGHVLLGGLTFQVLFKVNSDATLTEKLVLKKPLRVDQLNDIGFNGDTIVLSTRHFGNGCGGYYGTEPWRCGSSVIVLKLNASKTAVTATQQIERPRSTGTGDIQVVQLVRGGKTLILGYEYRGFGLHYLDLDSDGVYRYKHNRIFEYLDDNVDIEDVNAPESGMSAGLDIAQRRWTVTYSKTYCNEKTAQCFIPYTRHHEWNKSIGFFITNYSGDYDYVDNGGAIAPLSRQTVSIIKPNSVPPYLRNFIGSKSPPLRRVNVPKKFNNLDKRSFKLTAITITNFFKIPGGTSSRWSDKKLKAFSNAVLRIANKRGTRVKDIEKIATRFNKRYTGSRRLLNDIDEVQTDISFNSSDSEVAADFGTEQSQGFSADELSDLATELESDSDFDDYGADSLNGAAIDQTVEDDSIAVEVYEYYDPDQYCQWVVGA